MSVSIYFVRSRDLEREVRAKNRATRKLRRERDVWMVTTFALAFTVGWLISAASEKAPYTHQGRG